MKKIFLVFVFAFYNESIAQEFNPYRADRITTNNFGTTYYYRGGRYLGTSRPNIMGGRNYYDNNSRFSQSYKTGTYYQYRGKR